MTLDVSSAKRSRERYQHSGRASTFDSFSFFGLICLDRQVIARYGHAASSQYIHTVSFLPSVSLLIKPTGFSFEIMGTI